MAQPIRCRRRRIARCSRPRWMRRGRAGMRFISVRRCTAIRFRRPTIRRWRNTMSRRRGTVTRSRTPSSRMRSRESCEGGAYVIRTVTGDVDSIRGRILPHEHLQIDLSAQKGPANKIGEQEMDAVVEDLRTAKEYGLAAITDLSAPLWGRDPTALRRISQQAGVAVICAAGFYWDPFPDIAERAS